MSTPLTTNGNGGSRFSNALVGLGASLLLMGAGGLGHMVIADHSRTAVVEAKVDGVQGELAKIDSRLANIEAQLARLAGH